MEQKNICNRKKPYKWDKTTPEQIEHGKKVLECGRKYPLAFQLLSDDDLDDLETAIRILYLRSRSDQRLEPAEYFWDLFRKERKRRANKYKRKLKKSILSFLLFFLGFLLGLIFRHLLH